MPDYVTHGTVQFVKRAGNETVQIAPTHDYAIKHKDKRYVVFIGDPPAPVPPNPPNLQPTKGFDVEYAFTFLPDLAEILKEAAFKRMRLKSQ